MNEKKLYEIKQGVQTLYGHKLAVNSQGLWVMEVKGSGDIITVDKADVEEVLPHTVSVSFSSTGKQYAYLAPVGKYKVGEYYLLEASSGRVIVKVEAVDTKSRAATVELSVVGRLVLEAV